MNHLNHQTTSSIAIFKCFFRVSLSVVFARMAMAAWTAAVVVRPRKGVRTQLRLTNRLGRIGWLIHSIDGNSIWEGDLQYYMAPLLARGAGGNTGDSGGTRTAKGKNAARI